MTGADYSTVTDANEEPQVHIRAAGLSLVDTGDWSIRRLDEKTSDLSVVASTLLAFGDTSWGDPTAKGIGLVGYAFDGRRLFQVLKGRRIGWVETTGELAYALVDDRRRILVDALSGRILARWVRAKPLSVLPN